LNPKVVLIWSLNLIVKFRLIKKIRGGWASKSPFKVVTGYRPLLADAFFYWPNKGGVGKYNDHFERASDQLLRTNSGVGRRGFNQLEAIQWYCFLAYNP